MKKSIKLGLALAAINTLAVFFCLSMFLLEYYDFVEPVGLFLLAADIPATILLVLRNIYLYGLFAENGIILWSLLFGFVGGAWWFLIGWAAITVRDRLKIASANFRFASTFTITIVIISIGFAWQYAFTFPNTADDGCAYIGFPFRFFRDCAMGVDLTYRSLALDGLVWFVVATLVSYHFGYGARRNQR